MKIVSSNRIVSIVPPWTQIYRWPVAEPDDDLDYGIDVSYAMADVGDTISSVSASIAPSGSGELTPLTISFSNNIVTIWLSGGVAGRIYSVNFEIATTLDRLFSFYVQLPIDISPIPGIIPPPPNPGYGTPIAT